MLILALRLACKCLELTTRLVSVIRRALAGPGAWTRDPTRILLENFTPAQQQAALELLASKAEVKGSRPTRLLILVPFRDRWSLTEHCLRSLLQQQIGGILEVRLQLIDNDSMEPATKAGLKRLEQDFHSGAVGPAWSLDCLKISGAFNFSQLNNLGVGHGHSFQPDWLLFLNNDIEFPSPSALATLVQGALTVPRLGALGCTLLYPSRRIQHLFVAPGVKIVAAHPLKGRKFNPLWAWFAAPRPVAAVTGAALLVRADNFAQISGFDEALPSVGQDVDLCLKLQKIGLVNWVWSPIHLIHHEGASRGHAIDKNQVQLVYRRWGDFLTKNPYFSTCFSRFSEPPALRLHEPAYPWFGVLK